MIVRPAFVSLRWKILVPLVFLVVVINVLLYGYINQQLLLQYEATRSESHAANLKALNGSLTTSYHKLLEVAQTITALTQTSGSDQNQYVQIVFDYDFAQLEAQGVLDSAVLFSPEGELIMTWGVATSSFDFIVKKAIAQEYPVRDLVCLEQCSHYIAIPLLSNGHVSGVLVVGRVIQGTVLDFKQLTGVDIGIAKKIKESESAVTHWPLLFTQMTQKNQNIQLLNLLSQTEPKFVQDTLYSVRAFGHSYDVFFTVPDSIESDETVWVLIADKTQNVNRLKEIQFKYKAGMIVASMMLILLIGVLVGCVIKRLKLILKQAPSRSLLNTQNVLTKTAFTDEIDQIRQCIVRNEEYTSLSNHELQVISPQLFEKDIIANLMGNANSVVLTQCMDGRVLTVNELAKQLFGEFKDCPEQMFSDSFLVGDHNKTALDDINKLYIGRENLVCFEARCLDIKGETRYLYWIHTNMESNLDHPVILSIGIDITSNKKAEERLAWLAFHDPVTEVANKHLFLQLLPEMMASSLENESSLAVMCCEVKKLTDSHFLMDPADGNVTLFSVVAKRVSSCLRGDDLVARFGDDLFMIILNNIKTKGNAASVAKKIITAFEEPFFTNGCHFKVSINIGISIFPNQSSDVAELVQSAEMAMYLSKEEGLNNFEYSVEEHSLASH
ncbi:diguanylate cyclase domain-containing protein [Neptunomonas japonica]|uniref:diguanylate cyclase domain-containing protein n=1 Tax=Neptunomonas japonica TaxID=417574 RepID=UPI000406E8F3|nr:diguanylate cyclase [Neptunomonas japonica]